MDDVSNDVQALRDALAAGPTRGPWHFGPGFGDWQIGSDHSVGGKACKTGRQLVAHCPRSSKRATPAYAAMFEATGRFIAAASPDRIARLLDALQQAQRERDEARQDARLLDWLQTNGHAVACIAGAWYGGRSSAPHGSLRQAIDAAMQQQEAGS